MFLNVKKPRLGSSRYVFTTAKFYVIKCVINLKTNTNHI